MKKERQTIKIQQRIIPELIGAARRVSSTLAVTQDKQPRQALKTLKKFQGLTLFKTSHKYVGQVLPDNKGRSLPPRGGRCPVRADEGVSCSTSLYPALQTCGMTSEVSTSAKRGFTLLELLVVILIIAILAAIALPQYNKTVMISKATEAKLLVREFEREIDMYLLTYGWPAGTVYFSGRWNSKKIDFMEGQRWGAVEQYGRKGDYSFWAQCNSNECYLTLIYCPNMPFPQGHPGYDSGCGSPRFQFKTSKIPTSTKWNRVCSRSSLCASLMKGL